MSDTTRFPRAFAQLVLGILQIGGATTATIYLIQTGLSTYTVAAVAFTGILTGVSRFCFRREPISVRRR
jgi:hypothetical protein